MPKTRAAFFWLTVYEHMRSVGSEIKPGVWISHTISLLVVCAVQLLCVPIGGRHFGSRPALEALKDTLRTFCAAPALMPKYFWFSLVSSSSVVMIIVSKSKLWFQKTSWEIENAIISLWERFSYDFNAFYKQHFNCIFTVHAIRTAHNYFIIVTHVFCAQMQRISWLALVIRDCYHLPPLSLLQFLFTNELCAFDIVVLCCAVIKNI